MREPLVQRLKPLEQSTILLDQRPATITHGTIAANIVSMSGLAEYQSNCA
jgi:hypothetical protein